MRRSRHAVVLWLVLGCVALCSALPRQTIITGDGRHVCMTEKQVERAVKRRESYYKPQHHKFRHTCLRDGKYQMCTSFRVVYKMAYRDVIVKQFQTQMVYACCPGWEQYQPREKACLKPICEDACQNAGVCIGPDKCKCAKGWRGKFCQKDVDECEENTDGCSQQCSNTPGGYTCGCDDGFTLNADRSSCKLCLSCLPEYTEMTTGYKELSIKVDKLEKDKEQMKEEMRAMQSDHQYELKVLRDDVKKTLSAGQLAAYGRNDEQMRGRFGDDTSHRIDSLSEQMGMLEERLGECTRLCVRN